MIATTGKIDLRVPVFLLFRWSGAVAVRRFWGTLTPDFSMYIGWPLILQQWNRYRSQWLGRYWQEHGVKVIPTVNWSGRDRYDWCFAGIPSRQVVALAVPG